ncbi:NAD-dependent epimerase/dehydratase family protein [Pseudomonas cremoricolorata]|uniref:3-beta hydroxysteroid dehydrogenase n=1 Tax=Pseudomonas cremoricolorata TaxID=157783 RepID=A0A089WFC0_9PSED|nr:NAD-dependent epimerase/dehydratase family protein [Pseudomonas cremoricolorata]AIR87985.1 3-beta hydroxysteroid dehydrogenase [Pseudomonas cremoricolorata]
MRILVTGASGFIGGRFARFALDQGLEVRINARRGEAVEHLVKRGAQFIPGDLADAELARRLCQGMDSVVHCAGAVGTWGRYQDFYQGNVVLTENIVEGCLKEHVRRLVHLSSASIYFTGRSRTEITEQKVPRRFHDHYAATRHLAEQKVFGAGEFGLEVLALRPRMVVGAGDRHLLPRLLAQQAKGRLAIIGNGLNKADFTSVHNLNEALLGALFADDQALNQAYNISNGQPLPLWDVLNYALRQVQMPQVTRYRSTSAAYTWAALNEAACLLWPGRPQPRSSRTAVQTLSRDFTLDISRARQLLDYRPGVSLWSALDEFCHWWQGQRPQS